MFKIDEATVILSLSGTYALIAMLPGPNLVMITRISLENSRRNALLAALGISLGAGLIGYAAFSGLAPYAALSDSRRLLTTGFAMLMIWMGLRAVLRTRCLQGGCAVAVPSSGRTCLRIGLLTAATNPVTLAFFLGLGTSNACGQAHCRPGSAFVAAFTVAFLWFGGVALSLTQPQAALLFRRAAPIVDKILGCVLLAYGVHALVAML